MVLGVRACVVAVTVGGGGCLVAVGGGVGQASLRTAGNRREGLQRQQ